MTANHEIFEGADRPLHNGDGRNRRLLFLPQLLRRESDDLTIRGTEQYQKAFEIVKKWADLETSGKLGTKKETSLQGEYLNEVFGTALGYTLFSENLEHWNLETNFSINGSFADGALGIFQKEPKGSPIAVIELKGPNANLDRDRFSGRTAVQQCWQYMNSLLGCTWGIVSNYRSIRIYHRDHTSRACQLFTLQDLRREAEFGQFYYIFERAGLIPEDPRQRSRAQALLDKTGERQREVGDDLYKSYAYHRSELIQYLTKGKHGRPLDEALDITQKLLDRIIFVAFCEDRRLLPENSLARAFKEFSPFEKVTNPRWRNFKQLFESIDKGNPAANISRFNGGLFQHDPRVDDLEIDDGRITFFQHIGEYDFRDEVGVDVLGHFFEKSVKDIERIRVTGGVLDAPATGEAGPKMAKSAERKRFGIYYTPPEFTAFIRDRTVGEVIKERFGAIARKHSLKAEEYGVEKPDPKRAALWRDCFDELRTMRVVDPACGSGAFLVSTYDLLEETYQDVTDHITYHGDKEGQKLAEQIPNIILSENLYGVDLNQQAVEITQLSLWLRSAQHGKTLADLSANIVCGNSLISDATVDPLALDWQKRFAPILERAQGGFDCVIGNPPWERMKLQEREFFDNVNPEIAAAVDAATRRKMIKELEREHPEVHERYVAAKVRAERQLTSVRDSDTYPLTGKGDLNTYSLFTELASQIVSPSGRVGLLVPSGIATDHTNRHFFSTLVEGKQLVLLYDFENRHKVFPDVDGRFKFSILVFRGKKGRQNEIDALFFAHSIDDVKDGKRHTSLTSEDIALLNPNTRTCPIFRTPRDAEITKAIYRRVPILVDESRKEGGNPWGIRFVRMFDQTNDAEHFRTAEQLKGERFKRDGARWVKGKQVYLPLYEAKMIQMYDHRAASVVSKPENWMRQGQTNETSVAEHQNPEHFVVPRWWVAEKTVEEQVGGEPRPNFIGFKDITSPTNTRTMIASALPWSAVTNHCPLVFTTQDSRSELCLLANFNSYALDFVARQKIGGVTLNFFIVEQLPVLAPRSYSRAAPWSSKSSLKDWISDRVAKLTCTSDDMIPLAEAAGFEPSVHKWDTAERANLQAELDAAFFLLYGISRDDAEYILSTFNIAQEETESLFGNRRPADLILHHYDELSSLSRSVPSRN
jgi:hypothetical protein